jgi:hypothetical protein
MTETTMVRAWEIAHTMIDGLEFDELRTERGCGKTWSKPNTNATVIDLGNRLEVNKENGETINIWIEPKSDEDTVASYSQPIIAKQVQCLTFAVDGYSWSNEADKRLYAKLSGDKFDASMAASDFVVAWCNYNNIKWGCVSISRIDHYPHGNDGGHYCITALIEDSVNKVDN